MNYCTTHIDLAALGHNWDILCRQAGDAGYLLPVVKADAYGHGLAAVARHLLQKGAVQFAVGSVAEAELLLGQDFMSPDIRVIALLGANDRQEAESAADSGIVPLLHHESQLAAMEGLGLDLAVKVDTGMSRLGFDADALPWLLDRIASMPGLRVAYLISHLASADEAGEEAVTAQQCERFRAMLAVVKQRWPNVVPSMANSAGLVLGVGRDLGGSLSRPGYSLYGGQPFPDREAGPLLPVMSVSAPVTSVRTVRAGERIGYGGTFTAPEDMPVAVVAAGYADGLPRSLKGRGEVCLHGRRLPLVGRVCMQMSLVDLRGLSEPVRPGDRAWFLGGEGEGAISASRLALAWGTIPYEVFCILGRNPRLYHELAD